MSDLGKYIQEVRENKQLSKRAVAEAASISHTEIHRIENGQRQNPSPPVLRAIALALGVPFEELMEKAGYINSPDEMKPTPRQNEDGKFIEVLTPKLIKEGWTVQPSQPSSISDLLAKKESFVWNFEFKYFEETAIANFANKNFLFNTYGKLAVYDGKNISKFTIVTNNKNAFNTYIKFAPINLKIKISVMLADFETNKITEEIDIN